jgi:hypothetical protein
VTRELVIAGEVAVAVTQEHVRAVAGQEVRDAHVGGGDVEVRVAVEVAATTATGSSPLMPRLLELKLSWASAEGDATSQSATTAPTITPAGASLGRPRRPLERITAPSLVLAGRPNGSGTFDPTKPSSVHSHHRPMAALRPRRCMARNRTAAAANSGKTTRAERRRNRTFQPWGCQGLPVLKGVVCRDVAVVWACFCSVRCRPVRSDSPSSGRGWGHVDSRRPPFLAPARP